MVLYCGDPIIDYLYIYIYLSISSTHYGNLLHSHPVFSGDEEEIPLCTQERAKGASPVGNWPVAPEELIQLSPDANLRGLVGNKEMGVSHNYGYLFGGSHNKDYSIWGFGKLPNRLKGLETLSPKPLALVGDKESFFVEGLHAPFPAKHP